MRSIVNLAWKLLLIAAVAGLALGVVNAFTVDPIAEQTRIKANAARKSVLPEADSFTLYSENTGGCLETYAGMKGDETVGYTAVVATKEGYGNEFEVTVGMTLDGRISGISIGGANFSETPGLGARIKEPAFTDQFQGLTAPVTLGTDIDAVTSATRSSRAATNAVNIACEYLKSLLS